MNEKSPPPYRREEYSLLLLDMYPEAKDIIIGWLEDNLIRFSCESLAMYMKNELGRKLYDKISPEGHSPIMTLKTQSTFQLLVSPLLIDILHYLAIDGVGEKKHITATSMRVRKISETEEFL